MTTNTVTYDQYLTEAAAFRDRLATGDFPEEVDDWYGVWSTATCHTTDCPAYGVPHYGRRIMNADGIRSMCGICQHPNQILADFTDVAGVELENVHPAPVPQPGPGDSGEEGSEGGEG